ncbi:hypothetical protein HMPREF2946_01150 [Actinomyces sp. HMSC062G12]|nr:hypothetical protein HMPREF2946_01150 [Actinomyces sp. HMSC062G12]
MTELGARGRAAYWVVAALAWAGVASTIIISTLGGYAPPTYYEEGLFGGAASGWAGAPQRLVECLSYFTELSNIMVALISTILARSGRVGRWGRAAHLCALMMITVTAIVYATLIGPYEVLSGYALVTNPLQHIIVPAVFVGVAAIAGPRGGITWGTLGRALLIPIAWVAYTLARGALVHQYPYGFVNVWRIGYAQVGVNIVAILIGALVFMGFFAAIDWAIRKTVRTETSSSEDA